MRTRKKIKKGKGNPVLGIRVEPAVLAAYVAHFDGDIRAAIADARDHIHLVAGPGKTRKTRKGAVRRPRKAVRS